MAKEQTTISYKDDNNPKKLIVNFIAIYHFININSSCIT